MLPVYLDHVNFSVLWCSRLVPIDFKLDRVVEHHVGVVAFEIGGISKTIMAAILKFRFWAPTRRRFCRSTSNLTQGGRTSRVHGCFRNRCLFGKKNMAVMSKDLSFFNLVDWITIPMNQYIQMTTCKTCIWKWKPLHFPILLCISPF